MSVKVLIVEDHFDSRNTLAWWLRAEGYEVTLAADGQEALEQIEVAPPDAIISDIMMPVLDGITMVLRLRQMPAYRHLPVLLVTSGGAMMQRQAVSAGADAVLRKPLQFDEVIGTLKKLLEQSKADKADTDNVAFHPNM